MLTLFRYNWQVREEWFDLCGQLPEDELLRERMGGVGSMLRTLFHIVDVEYSWIRTLQGKPDFDGKFEDYQTLTQVRNLSVTFHGEVDSFLKVWSDEMENNILTVPMRDGQLHKFTHGEVLRHVVAHEIHHIGQLSVWARELGLQPVSANVIGRGLFRSE
ncbi:DinB family protein [Paenactinomyces guangxiensis]|uniref:DinB family protein n=1 Tax=Paenactinomyces guangxiensis TaxID=1490290 RepID=A0A7W2A6X3_9BACL|nr:DinB family protein [Paenactinomyces guangxiensis]MBA4493891.1 DinB family protein [Paenactinomyces guangxiensis]MBH8591357.1 DinB family protein [Paenactinomyces guangxiensis]